MRRIKHSVFLLGPMISRVIFLILLNFLSMGISQTLAGQTTYLAQDVFTVANIYVDVTDKTASVARKKALAIGEKKAFEILLKRLTLRIDHDSLPVLDSKEISAYVQDFGITDEKNSEIRYLAYLTYRFKPNDIRFLLRDNNVQFAETISKPILILPVYKLAGAVFLWDDPNPWRDAWLNNFGSTNPKMKSQLFGLVPIIFGNGDLNDIATISAELAVKGDMKSLTAITKKYNVDKTLVAFSSFRSTTSGMPMVAVRVFEYNKDSQKHLFSIQIKANNNEDLKTLLDRVTRETAVQIEELWKVDNLLKFERIGVMAVTYPIGALEEWVDAKRRLMKVAVIENIELVIFSRKEVRFNIHFIGEAEQLQLALAQLDMELNEEERGWVLGVQTLTRPDFRQ